MGFLKSPSLPDSKPLVVPSEEDTLKPLTLEAADAARRRALIERRRRGEESLRLDPSLGQFQELTL